MTRKKKPLPKAGSVISAAEAMSYLIKPKTEQSIQEDVVKMLRALGYTVLVHNAGIRKEAAAALKAAGIHKGAIFQTPGCPDISYRKPSWDQGCWCMVELKTETGQMSPAQQVIHDAGGSWLCRSVDDVIELLLPEEQMTARRLRMVAA